MKFRKCIVGATALMAFTLNSPQVLADEEVVVFGEDFVEETPKSASPAEDEPPADVADEEELYDDSYSYEDFDYEEENVNFDAEYPDDEPVNFETVDVQPISEKPVINRRILPKSDNRTAFEDEQQSDDIQNSDDEDYIYNFNDEDAERPFDGEYSKQEPPLIFEPVDDRPINPPSSQTDRILPKAADKVEVAEEKPKKAKKLKKLDQRFIKLTTDANYTYYLDKESVTWRRVPYTASEYMAEVWVRLIERTNEVTDNIDSEFEEEIKLQTERGYTYRPEDFEVLNNSRYYLEHYYLRPKTRQIQFLGEVEVIGRPQNTISHREYKPSNWEDIIPSSIESVIYNTTLKEIGTKESDGNTPRGFKDYLEEVWRISIR